MATPYHALSQLLLSRASCRDFLPEAVPEAVIKRLIAIARAAPSSANLQPGKFHVLTGLPRDNLVRELAAVAEHHAPEPPAYSYFPEPMPLFLKQRQRDAGYALYRALNFQRRDITSRKQQFAANYRFFDAPVGIIVTIHKGMGSGCFMDLGMMMMSLLLACHSAGYGCCVIGAMSHYATAIQRLLALPDDEQVVCGIALGRANPNAAVNQFRTDRLALDDFATFYGFIPGEGE